MGFGIRPLDRFRPPPPHPLPPGGGGGTQYPAPTHHGVVPASITKTVGRCPPPRPAGAGAPAGGPPATPPAPHGLRAGGGGPRRGGLCGGRGERRGARAPPR